MKGQNFQEHVAAFLKYLWSLGNIESQDTLKWYKKRLWVFEKFVYGEQIQEPFSEAAFRSYARHLKDRDISQSYRRGCILSLNRFGRWLYEAGHVEVNLGEVLTLPELPKRPRPKFVAKKDIQAMLDAAISARDRALICVLRDTGCRAQELLAMIWCDVDLERGEIVVTGKFNETRKVHLTRESVGLLGIYQHQSAHNADEDRVWWSKKLGRSAAPLSYPGLRQVLRRLANRAGVEGRYNAHGFRHAYGRNLTMQGCPTRVLQELMGHRSDYTTKIYTWLDDVDLKRAYHQYCPYEGEA